MMGFTASMLGGFATMACDKTRRFCAFRIKTLTARPGGKKRFCS